MCDIIFGNYTTDEEYVLYVLIRASLKNSSVTDMNTTLNKDIYYNTVWYISGHVTRHKSFYHKRPWPLTLVDLERSQ